MKKEIALIWTFAVLFIGIVMVTSAVELSLSHQSNIQVAYTEADLSGHLVAEWIGKSLSSIRAILKDSLFDLDDSNISASSVSEKERAYRNDSLVYKANQYDNIIFLGIFDTECIIQYGSISSIIGDSSRDLKRNYCDTVAKEPLERLKFSDLFVSSTGELNVSATYPLLSSDNEIIGFSLASLNLSFFQTWLDSINEKAITISIMDMNQVLLARKPESEELGKRIEDSQLSQFIQSDDHSIMFRQKSPVDGIERLWSLRKTGDFPFIVAVGYEIDSVLIPWRHKLLIYSIGSLLLIILSVFLALAYQKNRINAQSMEKLAMLDPLTHLMNRRSFNTIAKRKFHEAKTINRIDSVIMIDVDHFKKINDKLGHDVGDIALKDIAHLVQTNFRSSDLVCRWGGEEFMVYLTDARLTDAKALAERLRQRIEEGLCNSNHAVTVSQGVASTRDNDQFEQMLKTADERLFKAKEQGRNRVCME